MSCGGKTLYKMDIEHYKQGHDLEEILANCMMVLIFKTELLNFNKDGEYTNLRVVQLFKKIETDVEIGRDNNFVYV